VNDRNRASVNLSQHQHSVAWKTSQRRDSLPFVLILPESEGRGCEDMRCDCCERQTAENGSVRNLHPLESIVRLG
jgi:hypothetical protein